MEEENKVPVVLAITIPISQEFLKENQEVVKDAENIKKEEIEKGN